MVEMFAVRTEERQSFQPTANDGQGNIENWQGKRKQWREESRRNGSFVGVQNAQAGDQKAQEVSAAIAHIDSSGREIETEESDQSATHAGSAQGGKAAATEAHIGEQSHQHQGDTASEAIDTIDDVDEVGKADEPQDRQRSV